MIFHCFRIPPLWISFIQGAEPDKLQLCVHSVIASRKYEYNFSMEIESCDVVKLCVNFVCQY